MELENQTEEITVNETPVNETETTVENDQSLNENVEPEFVPNYTYKAYGEEREIDEWVKPIVTKENQDQILKLYSQAGAFDTLKEKHDSHIEKYNGLNDQFNHLNSDFSNIVDQRDRLVRDIETGNLLGAFNTLGIKEEQVLDYAENLLAAMQSGNRSQFESKFKTIEQQNNHHFEQQSFQQERASFVKEQHEWEMSMTMQNPTYAPLIEQYNAGQNDPNAFRAVMDQIGKAEYFKSNGKVNISTNEAAERAIAMLGLKNDVVAPHPENQPIEPQNNVVQMNKMEPPKPITTISGAGSTTPVKKRPMSVADLQAEYQQKYGN